MCSVVGSDIGADAHQLVRDIRRFETTGLTRDRTWAPSGDREAQRRARHTMGYQTCVIASGSHPTDEVNPFLVHTYIALTILFRHYSPFLL